MFLVPVRTTSPDRPVPTVHSRYVGAVDVRPRSRAYVWRQLVPTCWTEDRIDWLRDYDAFECRLGDAVCRITRPALTAACRHRYGVGVVVWTRHRLYWRQPRAVAVVDTLLTGGVDG